LNSKLESEKSSPSRKEYTKKLYENFMVNVTSTVCEWKKTEIANDQIHLDCKKISVILKNIFTFNLQSDLVLVYI
jgi:hypothetical protein